MSRQKIGVLWKRTTSSGKTFLSGLIEEIRFDGRGVKMKVSIWSNDNKQEGTKQPDCIVWLDDYKATGKPNAAAAAPAADESPFPGEESAPSSEFPDEADDDLPF